MNLGSEHDPDVPECSPSAGPSAEGEHSGTSGSFSDPQLWQDSWAVTKSVSLIYYLPHMLGTYLLLPILQ